MPDILTHILVGISIGYLLRGKVKDEISLMIVLGSIIIDIERPIGWVCGFINLDIFGLTEGFHTIIGAVLLSFAAASLFEETAITRKTRFWYILIGAASHLLMDMTLTPWPERGLYLLYPLTIPFSFNLFWSDFMLYPLIGLAILMLSILLEFILRRLGLITRD